MSYYKIKDYQVKKTDTPWGFHVHYRKIGTKKWMYLYATTHYLVNRCFEPISWEACAEIHINQKYARPEVDYTPEEE